MRIRKATQQDLHSIMQLYENARAFMREHGNPGQWGTTYPPQNMIETDIRFGNLYVCIEKDTIEAVFFYKDGIDPTYLKIYDGQWKNGCSLRRCPPDHFIRQSKGRSLFLS